MEKVIPFIQAISELWLILLVFLGFVVVFKFDKQIAACLDNLKQLIFKHGNTEISMVKEDEKEKPIKEDIITLGLSSDNELAATAENIVQNESQEEPSFIAQMFLEKDRDKLEELHKKVQEEETNSDEKIRYESLFYYLSFKLGDTNAIKKLQGLLNREEVFNPSIIASIYSWLGFCFASIGDYDDAVINFLESSKVEPLEKDKADALVLVAENLYKNDKRDEAYSLLMDNIAMFSGTDVLAILYKGLSSLYGKDGEKEMQAITLGKVLQFKPNDTELLFDAAYKYSNGFDLLTLLHYNTLLKFSPDNQNALNNIGVQYNELKMPIMSIANYKKAFDRKNTLAGANLAFQYLNAGFVEEAMETIEKAKNEDNPHPNVGKAMASIQEQRDEEKELEEKYMSLAHQQQRFFRDFSDAYFKNTKCELNLDGKWEGNDKQEISIKYDGKHFEGYWTKYSTNYKMTAKINNLGFVVTIYKGSYSYTNKKEEFIKEKTGYGYISEDFSHIHMIYLEEKGHKFDKLKRMRSSD